MLVTAGAVWLTLTLFGPLLTHPGTYLLGAHGDSVKNIYSFLWYVLHDSGTRFTGMSYPFTEHIVYPDAQPALAWVVQGLQKLGVVPGSPLAVLACLHGALALGVATAPLVLYRLMRRAAVPGWYAAVAALLITFQSPQLDRLNGHFALAYPVVLPGLWLLVVRLIERPGVVRALALLAAITGAMLLTSYYLMGAALLAGGYAVVGVALARRPGRPATLRAGAWLLGVVGLAMAGTLLWLKLTDPAAAGRPTDPYGFFVYTSSPRAVLLPAQAPLLSAWQAIFRYDPGEVEGNAYVGMVPAAIALLLLVRAAGYVLRRRHRRPGLALRPALPTFLRTGAWVAILALLFSMAFPFRLGLEGLLDLLAPLKQLRALGRFAWVFYYIFTVWAAHYLWVLTRYLRQRGAGRFALTLLVLPLALWGVDAWVTSRRFGVQKKAAPYADKLLGTTSTDSYPGFLTLAHRSPADFQAILPLPYFAIGSEKWAVPLAGGFDFEVFRASLQLELPLAATMMSRTPLPVARALLQTVASPLIARDQLPPLPSARPYLLVVAAGAALPSDQQRLVAQAQPLIATDRVNLYALPVAALRADARAAALADTARRGPVPGAAVSAGPGVARQISGLAHSIVGEDFRQPDAGRPGLDPAASGRSAPGAAVQPRQPAVPALTLYDGPLPGPTDSLRYEASVWLSVRTRTALPWLHVKQLGPDGQVVAEAETDVKFSPDVQGDWVRATVTWPRHPAATRLLMYVDGSDLVADDLLVRPVRTHVWGRTAGGVVTRDGYGLSGTP